MPSVIEFIAECIANELDVSDCESGAEPPVSKLPKLSECFKRNPYYKKPQKEGTVSVLSNEAFEQGNQPDKLLSGLSKKQAPETPELGKCENIQDDIDSLTIQPSESETSQAFSEQIDEEFTLYLSEDEDDNESNDNSRTIDPEEQDINPANLQLTAKHIISATATKAKSSNIKCSDACIVSQELRTSSNEVFEQDDVKQDSPIKQSPESKKSPSSAQTPINFFNIFKTYLKVDGKEKAVTGSKNGDQDENSPISKPEAAITSQTSAKVSKPAAKENFKKSQKKVHPAKNTPSRNVHFCTTCRRQVESLTVLKQHFRMHANGKDPIVCSVCDRTFVTRSVLRRHLLIHSGDSRFSCSICDKKFIRSDYLSRHRRIIHKLS